jgi:ribonuclease VapC
MILDTSTLIAILKEEGDREHFLQAIALDQHRYISAASLFETAIVVGGLRDPVLNTMLDQLVTGLNLTIIAFTASQYHLARRAYQDYGKGSGHPAQLNFGDCFAYALAVEMNEPLLFKGNDFNHTDVRLVIPPSR